MYFEEFVNYKAIFKQLTIEFLMGISGLCMFLMPMSALED